MPRFKTGEEMKESLNNFMAKATQEEREERQALLDEFARAATEEDILSIFHEWDAVSPRMFPALKTTEDRAKARYAFAEQMMKAREV